MKSFTDIVFETKKKYKNFRVVKNYKEIYIEKGTYKSFYGNKFNFKIRTEVTYFENKKIVRFEVVIPYAEINAAILQVMNEFNGHELKELWKDKK